VPVTPAPAGAAVHAVRSHGSHPWPRSHAEARGNRHAVAARHAWRAWVGTSAQKQSHSTRLLRRWRGSTVMTGLSSKDVSTLIPRPYRSDAACRRTASA
jgi:hypothetical protein